MGDYIYQQCLGVRCQLASGFWLLVTGNGLQKITLLATGIRLLVKCARLSDFSPVTRDQRPVTIRFLTPDT